MQAFCLPLTITEGFAFFILRFHCSFVIRSGDLSSSSLWSHDPFKMAAAMAGCLTSLSTLGIVIFHSGSCFLARKAIIIRLFLFDALL